MEADKRVYDYNLLRKVLCLCGMMVTALLLSSCIKDATVSQQEILYGQQQDVKLSIGYALNSIDTRSVVNETLVENVNIYIVNEPGDLVAYGYYTDAVSVDVGILEKMKYTVYAIANAGKEIHATAAADIERLVYEIDDISQIANASGSVLMSGKSAPQLLEDGQKIIIDLKRCVAKVSIKADFSLLNEDVEIDIESVCLKNIPKSVKIFTDSKIEQASESINGELISEPTKEELSLGLCFYQYENRQGMLLPDNLNQWEKVFPESSSYRYTCSYLELKGTYSSPRKRGNILYRFYLGTDMVSNFDVIRNTHHNVTVNFKGDGAVDENTWRVDNSEIVDLVTSITLDPVKHEFKTLGAELQINATVLPLTANNKELEWGSSNETVAVVDTTGKVTSVGDGSCVITAKSTDGTNISATCEIVVNSKVYVESVTVTPDRLELYAGEQGDLEAVVLPENATVGSVMWSSSNESVATVDAAGKVTAVGAGECTVTATSTDDSSKKGNCEVKVLEKEFSINPYERSLYVGESFTINCMVKPPVKPVFLSETESVATVDENGVVKALSAGVSRIKVSAHGKELYCNITVVQPQIEFAERIKVMYDLEEAQLQYSRLVPSTAAVDVVSSDNSVVQIVESSSMGVKIRALKEGSAVIKATVTGTAASTSCSITVEKLRIVPAVNEFVVYNHFYYDVGYTIYPAHASFMKVMLESAALGKDNHIEPVDGYAARVIGNKVSSDPLPLKISIAGRDDAYANMTFVVKEPSMETLIRARVNYGREACVEKDLKLDIASHARLQYSLTPHATESFSMGNVESSIKVNLEESKVIFPNPNGTNGKYALEVSCVGDDNTAISLPCNIEVYETLYLVGISKTDTREDISLHKYCYYNEIIGEWLAHPNSVFYPEGAVNDISIPYIYNGKEYTDRYTEVIISREFIFEKDSQYALALDEGYFTYKGNNAPHYYHEYFALKPKENNPYQMDKDSKKHFYVYSRNFMSGFSNDSSPDWKKVFEYVYGAL